MLGQTFDSSPTSQQPEADAQRELLHAVAQYADDPLGYVLFAFPWGEGELVGHDGPDEWQAQVLGDIRDGVTTIGEAIRIATASGHGIGKSALVAWIVLWAMSCRPMLNGVVTANTGTQLNTKTWRELAVWWKRAINGNWFHWTATKFYALCAPETWFVAAVPWSEKRSEAFAGLHGESVLMIFDEASAIPDKIWDVAEGAQTTGEVIWCVFGNPTRNTGRFRECFGKFRHRWITRQIDSRNCKMANKGQAAEWVADYGEDSDFVRIRVRGEFPRSGSTQFIGDDLIEAAKLRAVVPDPGAPLLIGVDVARFGDDKTVIRIRRGRDARTHRPIKLRGADTMKVASRVVELADKLNPDGIFIDGTGVGAGVVDRVRALLGEKRARLILHEVNNGTAAQDPVKYHNTAAECWYRMREWITTASIDDDRDLRDDLVGREYGFDDKNRVQLEKKDDMKERGLASPDDADALAVTFAHPVGRRDLADELKRRMDNKRAGRWHRATGDGAWMT